MVVYLDVKISPDGEIARAAAQRSLASRLPWADVQVEALGITEEAAAFIKAHRVDGLATHMPDAWLDAFAAAGTPAQAAAGIWRLFDAGADTVVFQPLDGDPYCLDEYARYLMPLLK